MKPLDRGIRALLVLLVIGVWGLLFAPLFTGHTVEAQTRKYITRWEYTICSSNKVSEWNRFGDEGWEAISVDVNGTQLLMKRPK